MNTKFFLGAAIGLAVILLAGGAFMATRLLNAKAPPSSDGISGAPVTSGDGGSKTTSIQVQMDRSADLPQGKADLSGSVNEVKDNSIFVQPTSKVGGGANANSGPAIEVVITQDTIIWRDVSFDNIPKPQPGSAGQSLHIQQKLEPADMSQIIQENMVTVWGQRRGDRIIADVVVSIGPAVIQKKNGA
jgi:hypothetical protein